jgi:peptidoglycan/xylan/chitin deacetylase (PgdA/CDA1 family)
MIIDNGHQVGSHSYSHEYDKSHDIMALDDQISALNKSKRLLLDNGAREVTAFRAPALRVNSYTEEALSLCGFLTDSSVSSQRFDAFFSFGTLKKLKWLISPRKPYFTKKHNLFSKGNGQIFEIPISAMLLPYTGTVLRILPTLTSILRRFLILEASLTGKPIVFLIHPNELFLETVKKGINRRGANFLSHFLKDVLRTLLKRKNLGDKALKLYEREIIRLKESGFEFLTINEYYKIFGK